MRRATVVGLGFATIVGAVITGLGVSDTGAARLPVDIVMIGLCVVLISATCLLRVYGNRAADDMFEAGRDIGYRQGFKDGRKVAKPVLVPMVSTECRGCPFNRNEKAG